MFDPTGKYVGEIDLLLISKDLYFLSNDTNRQHLTQGFIRQPGRNIDHNFDQRVRTFIWNISCSPRFTRYSAPIGRRSMLYNRQLLKVI